MIEPPQKLMRQHIMMLHLLSSGIENACAVDQLIGLHNASKYRMNGHKISNVVKICLLTTVKGVVVKILKMEETTLWSEGFV